MIANYIYVLLYNLISFVAPLMVTPYLSKILGETNLGIYEYVTSVATIFTMLGNTGFPLYAKREIAIRRDNCSDLNVVYTELVVLHVIQNTLSLILFGVYILLVQDYKLVLLIALVGLLSTGFSNFWFYAGIEKFSIVSLREVALKILMFIGVFTLVKTSDDLPVYVAVMYGSNILVSGFYFFYAFKYVRFSQVSIKGIFSHLKPSIYLMIPSCMATLYATIDKLLLSHFSTMEQNGYYGQAHKIIVLAVAFTTAIGTVIMPSMAYDNYHGKGDELKKIASSALDVMCMIAIPAIIGLWVTMDGITPWLFDNKFVGIEIIIKMFLPLILLEGISDIVGTQLMTARGQDKQLMGINVIFIIVDIILDIALMPSFGALGGVIATILAITIKTIIILVVCKSNWSVRELAISIIRYTVISLVMAIMVVIAKNNIHVNSYFMNTVIQVLMGVIVYFISLLITRNIWLMSAIKKVKSKLCTTKV